MFHVWGNRHNLILYIEYGLKASFDRYKNIRSMFHLCSYHQLNYLQYLHERMQKSKHYVTS